MCLGQKGTKTREGNTLLLVKQFFDVLNQVHDLKIANKNFFLIWGSNKAIPKANTHEPNVQTSRFIAYTATKNWSAHGQETSRSFPPSRKAFHDPTG